MVAGSKHAVVLASALACVVAHPLRAATNPDALDLDTLYAPRLRFDASGQPLVSVGLMDGQVEVGLVSLGDILLQGPDGKNTRTVRVAAGRHLRVRMSQGQPAGVKSWAVLETLERDERLRREDAQAHWQKRLGSPEVRLFEVGGIYGVEGTVVDNRATLVAVAAPDNLKADAYLQQLYDGHGVRARLHEELVTLPRGRLTVVADDGTTLGSFVGLLELESASGHPITVERVEHSAGYKNHGVEDRVYAARLVVAADRHGKLAVVNILPVDDLLKGIVPSEIFPNAPAEALKAQAVTARGEAFAKVGLRHLTDPYALCDEQHCQVYSGTAAERAGTSAAVDATRGEMAFLGGRLVDSVYSAMCGGRSEDNEVVWEVPPSAALRGRVDFDGATELLASHAPRPTRGDADLMATAATTPGPHHAHPGHVAAMDLHSDEALRRFLDDPPPAWCQRATLGRKDRFRWERRIPLAEATERLKDLVVGEPTALVVETRGPSGRVRTLRVEGRKQTAHVHRELPVRRLLGNLPSGMFVVDTERAEDGSVVAFVLKGGGYGHGVGMCQTGAVGMAEAGQDYRAILRHYYNGANVQRVY